MSWSKVCLYISSVSIYIDLRRSCMSKIGYFID
jgi:hypothetical protein